MSSTNKAAVFFNYSFHLLATVVGMLLTAGFSGYYPFHLLATVVGMLLTAGFSGCYTFQLDLVNFPSQNIGVIATNSSWI